MKSFWCINLLMLMTTMILYPAYGSSLERQPNSNETNKNYNKGIGQTDLVDKDLVVGSSKVDSKKSDSKSDMYSNPRFALYDNQSGTITFALPSYWDDPFLSCRVTFKCVTDNTTGWKNGTSLQISTTNNTNNTWSWIQGKEIDVKPKELYEIVTHMKLNEWAWSSHIVFEGFNQTSKSWYKIKQCPYGFNGTLPWQEFSCNLKIPEKTSKIRPVLNAGWSSHPGKQATTWFDTLFMVKLSVSDPKLRIELVYDGLKHPTSMAFLGPNDIVVLERNNGTVQRIVNGVKSDIPLLDRDVATNGERGMVGIAVKKNVEITQSSIANERTYVFLYFTAAEKDDQDFIEGKEPLGNRLYRYEFVNNSLVNPLLLLDLPATPGPRHNGGALSIGPDGNLYLIVGDIDGSRPPRTLTKAQNYKNGTEPDGRSGILRISQDGNPVGEHGVLGDSMPLRLYYAYGIRNGFGLDFDPITGSLWDTENGPGFSDEINLVKPGFNSGWALIQGIENVNFTKAADGDLGGVAPEKPSNLTDFNGTGEYSPPEFIWNHTVGPTALKFLTTDKLGKEYKNDIFVGDVHNGRIYHFKLNQNRTALLLNESLSDKIADTDDELDGVVSADGLGSITDIEIGPDGYPYFVDYIGGKIYRIVPNHQNQDTSRYLTSLP
jgi:aldose sugar dehydrogenase